MPNRMLRDWTLSESHNMLSAQAERFFTRLFMKADDYGYYYADTRLLKLNLFPLLLDSIKEPDITKWLTECQVAGLIYLYEHEGKNYLQINDFKQRTDKSSAKFPIPTTAPLPVTQPEPKQKKEPVDDGHSEEDKAAFKKFQEFLSLYAPRVAKMTEPFTIKQFITLKKDFTPAAVKDMVMKMHNYKPLLTKNTSANLTFRKWSEKDFNQTDQPDTTKPNLSAAVKNLEQDGK